MVMWILGRNHMCQITVCQEDRRIVLPKDPPKSQQTLASEGPGDSTRFKRTVQKAMHQKGLDNRQAAPEGPCQVIKIEMRMVQGPLKQVPGAVKGAGEVIDRKSVV